ncbi:MAG: hypothetical protein PHH85_01490, partial [Candidatus Methanoperedens sp.]|nr:hypothetical protein [Candidatus Methanoperedens sp.]
YFHMKPFLAKGYAKRKLHTGNQSVQFDEEREVERPLFYSTIRVHLLFLIDEEFMIAPPKPNLIASSIYPPDRVECCIPDSSQVSNV